MTSRRRRMSLASVLVVLALTLGVVALRGLGVFPADESSSPAGGAAAGSTPDGSTTVATDDPTITTEPGAPVPSRASSPTATGAAPGGTSSASAGAATARSRLAALPVKGKSPATGYDREGDFGTAWLDVDRNGCDTRNDVLARDLTDVTRQGPCKVLTGTLVSPYTGGTVDFVRGNTTSTLVQIDHVVALENAWRTGAQQLTQSEREALANDPENLFAVDGRSNSQKRSGDAATWLPSQRSFRCTYVEHQVAVKTAYRLWVVPAERDAIARVLDGC